MPHLAIHFLEWVEYQQTHTLLISTVLNNLPSTDNMQIVVYNLCKTFMLGAQAMAEELNEHKKLQWSCALNVLASSKADWKQGLEALCLTSF